MDASWRHHVAVSSGGTPGTPGCRLMPSRHSDGISRLWWLLEAQRGWNKRKRGRERIDQIVIRFGSNIEQNPIDPLLGSSWCPSLCPVLQEASFGVSECLSSCVPLGGLLVASWCLLVDSCVPPGGLLVALLVALQEHQQRPPDSFPGEHPGMRT